MTILGMILIAQLIILIIGVLMLLKMDQMIDAIEMSIATIQQQRNLSIKKGEGL